MTSESPGNPLYRQAAAQLAARGLSLDGAQHQALTRLADWLQARLQPSAWRRRAPAGAYLWGGVGRGKSLLLDSLFAAAPLTAKRRVHVHQLLQELQQRLLVHSGQADPLARVAAELAGEAHLLCFDEFHVHDIGDAILLGRLLQQLLNAGTILLFSSNYAPAQLCPNPLYHSRFRPFAELLERHCLVVEMAAGVDYRPLSDRHWGHYLQAPEAGLETLLAERLQLVMPAAPLALGPRQIQPLGQGREVLWLSFSELCQRPLASADYLDLCRRFARLAVSGLPELARCSADAQQRLVNFVDIAYDAGRELLLHGEQPLEALCAGVNHIDFGRTRSRLAQLRRLTAADHREYQAC
ncbi:cell division protein ZapE [Pseudomonas sp. AN-1]|uniref:cell division protein ZapE n=1 Tax=Pseudomonas sp. AN-1 TaxID=3096605 RepID=UPI002A6AC40C|nr:cell division protein ZapE [Pseudomonas sp. AN-1]WPP46993.1 cell division protein ZapE [Pseudomonas sp. AN-1]